MIQNNCIISLIVMVFKFKEFEIISQLLKFLFLYYSKLLNLKYQE
jgi:hypothetical protein